MAMVVRRLVGWANRSAAHQVFSKLFNAGGHELREYQVSYYDHFALKNTTLSHENGHLWRVYYEIPI